MPRQCILCLLLAALQATAIFGQPPVTRLNPAVKQIVGRISEDRIGATMKTLESFATRYVLSEQDNFKLSDQLVKEMKTAKDQGWGKITLVLPPLPGVPF